MVSTDRLNQVMKLMDGRRLGFAEIGPPTGTAVIYCHGFPGSRLEGRLLERPADRRGVRVIAPDRPGYGLSDEKSERTISEWTDDIAQLADYLELEQFSVLATSGGGPYGLALAHRLAARIRSLAVVCGLGPIDRTEALRSMRWPARFGFRSAQGAAWLTQLIYGEFVGRLMRRRPEFTLSLLTVAMPAADRLVLAKPEVRTALCDSMREAVRSGVKGALQDLVLYAHDWGFNLAGIRVPVTFWHGEADATVPMSHTLLVAELLPHAEVHRLPGEGHFSLPINRADEILETLLNPTPRSA
jgi:pimeloyl-ACP methyl ester carboxylesterase